MSRPANPVPQVQFSIRMPKWLRTQLELEAEEAGSVLAEHIRRKLELPPVDLAERVAKLEALIKTRTNSGFDS